MLVLLLGMALGINAVFSLIGDTGKFWHLTDVHYDPLYSQHGAAAKQCHFISNSTRTPGYYGNYLCDSSWNLVLSVVKEMKEIEKQPDFILWTGDTVPHVDQTSVEDVYTIISNVTNTLSFPATPPVVPVLGNHDSFPSNQMPLVGKDGGYYENILSRAGWSAFLNIEEQQQFLAGGYYAKTYRNSSTLRFLVLNSNLWYSLNKLVRDISDPNKQFAWLSQQLEQAKTQNYKVYIVAHVCPGGFERLAGMTWFYPRFNRKYVDLVQQYSTSIAAHFCGHEHTDSFRIVTDKDGSPSSVMFLSPAVTPWQSPLHGVGANNPGVRVYQYTRSTGNVLDYFQYYMNLTLANKNHRTTDNSWQLEYHATSAYSIPDCSAGSFHNLMTKLSSSSSLFKRYLQYNTVSYITAPSCDQQCFMAHTCAILHIDIHKYNACLSESGTTQHPGPDKTTQHPGPDKTTQHPGPDKTTQNPGPDKTTQHPGPDKTTQHPGPESSTKHHRHRPPPLPHYVYYIIGGMGFLIVVLAAVVSCLCVRRRRHGIPFKYGRFVGTIN